MTLTTIAAFDRPFVTTSRSERYLMLSLAAPDADVRRLPLNLALVIDRSGSMTGEKLARAKEAAAFVVRHLTAVDRVAIVAYDDEVQVIAPSTPVTATARITLLHAIAAIQTDGSTNLSGGWLTGCQEVARHQQADAQLDRVIVLTDGLANVGITAVEELVAHAKHLHSCGIVTSTMGIGADFNEELLEAMARHGGGRFQYVETAKHIPDCVQGELGEMLQLAARKVAIEVELPAGIRAEACLNDYPLEETPRGVRLYLGDLIAGDTRHTVLKIITGPGIEGATVRIVARVLYVDTQKGLGCESAFSGVEIRYADQLTVDMQLTNDAVAREVALLLAAHAKEEAARLSRRGDHSAAAGTLRAASVALQASPAAPTGAIAATIADLGALAAEADHGMNETQRKEMHYQSYLARETRRRYDGKDQK